MKIESLTQFENKKDRIEALFEDGTSILVGVAQIADFGLYSGRELSDDEYAQLRGETKLSSSKARAMRILGSRNFSSGEMERRLVSKGESQDTARKTVQWLEDIGAVNDAEYAAAITQSYCAKGYGLARIKDELYRRGIPRELWDDALSGLDNADDSAVYSFLEKKLGGSRDRSDIRRATNALCARGFSYEQARSVVGRYLESIEENESLN